MSGAGVHEEEARRGGGAATISLLLSRCGAVRHRLEERDGNGAAYSSTRKSRAEAHGLSASATTERRGGGAHVGRNRQRARRLRRGPEPDTAAASAACSRRHRREARVVAYRRWTRHLRERPPRPAGALAAAALAGAGPTRGQPYGGRGRRQSRGSAGWAASARAPCWRRAWTAEVVDRSAARGPFGSPPRSHAGGCVRDRRSRSRSPAGACVSSQVGCPRASSDRRRIGFTSKLEPWSGEQVLDDRGRESGEAVRASYPRARASSSRTTRS